MSLRVFGQGLALLLAVAGQLLAQESSFPVKHCGDPKPVIGIFRASGGLVQFKLDKDGKPGVPSLGIERALGISAEGLKSAAARQLGACVFEVSKEQQAAIKEWPVLVSAEILLRNDTVTFEPAALVQGARPLVQLSMPSSSNDTTPLAFDDPRIEESPRVYECKQANGLLQNLATQQTSKVASREMIAQFQAAAAAEAKTASDQYAAANSGMLVALVRVSVDGKPGSQIKVVKITNPGAAQSLGDRIGTCRFAPARIGGVPVPAFTQFTQRG